MKMQKFLSSTHKIKIRGRGAGWGHQRNSLRKGENTRDSLRKKRVISSSQLVNQLYLIKFIWTTEKVSTSLNDCHEGNHKNWKQLHHRTYLTNPGK
jgi:hypothetical protein